ncbi:cytochrome c-type biogenesis protein [Occallatibacter savannae]|uniref:cytochrome c-type biogenesis protein n=1 Tax=Occallatibacter savannae TaxID=1002691 RepID=UPI000D687728|nr:cytochrome c-type biogenesis protein CcmH [Occallatibacter savannae]
MFRNRKLFRGLQAAFLAVAVCFSIGATDATARYDKLSHQFMCSCGCGQVLGECNHVGCPASPVQLAELKVDMTNGMGDKEIMDSFAAKYGATVLAAPTTTGFNLVAWIAPFAVFLAALLGTILLVRHWSLGKKQVAEPASTPEMNAIRDRIRRETGSEGSF